MNITTKDTIHISHLGKVADVKVKINVLHSNDYYLLISLQKQSFSSALSLRNGNGEANYINTNFTDTASHSITQGTPPFTGYF